MKLTRVERLILINQYEILNRLDESNEYDENIEILRNGFSMFYSELNRAVDESEMDEHSSREVLTTLQMYMLIADYIGANPADTGVVEHSWAKFPGYDGNNESEQYSFAKFLIETQGKFKPVKFKNSHMPTVDKYRAMVAEYRKHEGTLVAGRGLARDSVLAILNAGH